MHTYLETNIHITKASILTKTNIHAHIHTGLVSLLSCTIHLIYQKLYILEVKVSFSEITR